MKVLLIQCPVYDVEMPPLGLAYLVSILKKNNFSVELLDINIDFFHTYPQYKAFWKPDNYGYCLSHNFFLKNDELNKISKIYVEKVLRSKANIIGFSLQTTSSAFSTYLSSKIKEADSSKIIVFGGPECSREEDPGYFLKMPGKADYVVLGEGEISFVEMLNRISKRASLEECKGLLFLKGEKIITTGARDFIINLDELPFPDFSLFPLDKYLHKKSLPVLMSRGCINRCIFCFDTWYQGKYRNRNSRKLLEEILYLHKNYSLRRMKFNDLLINGNLKLLEDICDALIDVRINDLFWSGNMAIRADMPRYLFRKMYKAGCRSITFGIESAANTVLKMMRKNHTQEGIVKNLKETARCGIEISTNWIVGFPGETLQDLFFTMKFIARNRKYIYAASAANRLEIVRGSSLYRNHHTLNIEFYSSRKWRCADNDETERIRRQNIFNEFLRQMGILNTTHRTEDIYKKENVSWFKIGRILRDFGRKLFRNKNLKEEGIG